MARYRPRSIWPKFCASKLVPTLSCARPDATRLDAKIAATIAAPTLRHARGSRMDERVRGSRVLGPDRLGRTLSRTSERVSEWLGESAEQRYWVGPVRNLNEKKISDNLRAASAAYPLLRLRARAGRAVIRARVSSRGPLEFTLHFRLSTERFFVAFDGCDSKIAAVAAEAHQAIPKWQDRLRYAFLPISLRGRHNGWKGRNVLSRRMGPL
jgi:hypothetical protein